MYIYSKYDFKQELTSTTHKLLFILNDHETYFLVLTLEIIMLVAKITKINTLN